MTPSRSNLSAWRLVPLVMLLLVSCDGAEELPVEPLTPTASRGVLSALEQAPIVADGPRPLSGPPSAVWDMARAAAEAAPADEIVVDYPLDGSIFPPDLVAPTLLWHDGVEGCGAWLISFGFTDPKASSLSVLVRGDPPPRGEIDLSVLSAANVDYEGKEYQLSARSWTPSPRLWAEIKRRTREAPVKLTITGYDRADLDAPLSRGEVTFKTSRDPVGAALFYRDVPLIPSAGEKGTIKPVAANAVPVIAWRVRDVSKPRSKLVMKGLPTCANCHSFSLDGKTLGMDVDGPRGITGDKGMYAVKPISKAMEIGEDDVLTWNSFEDKPEGHRTIGFMSRLSPDARYVASTVNEALYVSNFENYEFVQVFFPTRGILAYHDNETGVMKAIPGADDPEYVHCSPAWSPDGKSLIFSRAKAFDPYPEGQLPARYPNDPREPKMRYDLYRIEFNEGKGGTPVPVTGASDNGMSNSFPKVSPDGKWIVWVKAKNGLLMRPDGRLWIVPFEGGEPREMACNTSLMNSWHSFTPNSRWMVFSSKSRRPFTQAFLTHIDEDGNDSPAILVPNCTAANRAVNLPEFVNAPAEEIDSIRIPFVQHFGHMQVAEKHAQKGNHREVIAALEKTLDGDPDFMRALVMLGFHLMHADRHEAALIHLERAVALAPKHLFGLLNLGHCYRVTGRAPMAVRVLGRLVTIAPKFPNAASELERAREEAARLEARVTELEKALAEGGNDLHVRRELAALYQKSGRLEDAIAQLDHVIGAAANDPVSLSNLAWLRAACPEDGLRDGEKAIELATRAAKITGWRRPEPLMVLAAAYAEAGRHGEARQTAEKALSLAKAGFPGLVVEIESRLKIHGREEPIRAPAER